MPRKQKKTKIQLPEKKHESGTRPIIIIDGMNLAYRASYAYAKIKKYSVEFGAPTLIKSWITANCWNAEKIVVVWDGEVHPKRLQLLPTYKAHRKLRRDPKAHKKFLKQVWRLRRLLYYMGIVQIHNPKVEGDDMIYIATKYYSSLAPVLIISNDKDFDQLVTRDISIFNPGKKADQGGVKVPGLVGVDNYGVKLPNVIDFHCLVGDKSDDIPGYLGIGPVRAANFLEKHGSIKAYLKNKDASFPGLVDKTEVKKLWKRNRTLIDLKYFNEKYNPDADMTYFRGKSNPNFNERKFKERALKYHMRTFVKQDFISFLKRIHA